jgi:CRISPR/Cas system-associated protein Cas10 (large subunit of type III CRISPR-Cas system)
MPASGTYSCTVCNRHFEGTFSIDEESICPACQPAREPKRNDPSSTFDMLKPPSMEEIEGISYL